MLVMIRLFNMNLHNYWNTNCFGTMENTRVTGEATTMRACVDRFVDNAHDNVIVKAFGFGCHGAHSLYLNVVAWKAISVTLAVCVGSYWL